MKILLIDTVPKTMAVALVSCNNVVQRCQEMTPEAKHDRSVIPLVNEVMTQAGVSFADINAYAVNVGPGGFTGPRIGVSVVKAFALVHPRPIIVLNTFDVEAVCAKFTAGNFTPIEELEPAYNGEYVVTVKKPSA